MRRRISTDTSVIGGCLDADEVASNALMNRFRDGDDVLVLSDLTRAELARAPSRVRSVLTELPQADVEHVELTAEAAALAESYVEMRVVGESMRVDAQHIATATVNRVDVLVSWNFKVEQ